MNRWTFIITGLAINLCLGTIYAWSVFRSPLHEEPYGLTAAQSVIPFSVFLLAFGVSFAFSGRMIGKVGPRQPALIGAGLLGVGYLLCYSIAWFPGSSLGITTIAFGLIAGIGCGYAYNPPIAVVGRWFPDKRGLSLGLTVMGFGLSALVTAPAVAALVSILGLANTFLILGIVFLVLLALLGSMMKFPSSDWKAPSPQKSKTIKPWSAATKDYTISQMTKTSTFYITWTIFLIGAGAGLMIIGYAKLIAIDITGLKGDLEWLAILSVSFLAVSNAVGRPVFGAICDRIGPKKTLLTMQAIQLICLVGLFPYSKSIAVLYFAIALFASTFGAYLAVMPTLVSYFFGTKNLGPNYGLYLSAYGAGGVVCPMLMAIIVGSTPTYETYVQGFYATAGLLLIAIFLSLIMKTPKASEPA
ncbi:MFS transporter [Candidatus Bathyarchaeota archaeon]|nr:MAG: MFS transporter [Candidatus Bathyarchaeota archaeon]